MTVYEAQDSGQEKRIVVIAYALFAVAVLGLWVPSIAGVVINYLKIDNASPLYASHHRWMIHTFWWAILWCIIGAITWFLFVGWIVLLVTWVWYIYRHIRGLICLADDKPMPACVQQNQDTKS